MGTSGTDSAADGKIRQDKMPSRSEQLTASAAKMDKRLRALIRTRLEMASILQEVRSRGVPDREIAALLMAEYGWARGDINSAMKLAAASQDIEPLKGSPKISSSLLDALSGAGPHIRKQTVAALLEGRRMTPTAVKDRVRFERQRALSHADRRSIAREKVIARSATLRARDAVAGFRDAFSDMAVALVNLYGTSAVMKETVETYNELSASLNAISERGKACVSAFAASFDTSALPPAREFGLNVHPDEEVMLARAWQAIRRIADGRFQLMDPESLNPYDRRHPYIDIDVVEPVAWLFDLTFLGLEGDEGPDIETFVPAAVANTPRRKLTSLEICAGGGGMAIGLHAAGFRSAGLYEQDSGAVATLRDPNNCNDWKVHEADVRKVDFRRYRGHIDLVAGGVPCQPHSSLGHREGANDPRDLFPEALRMVDEVRPRAFFFENVEGFAFGRTAQFRAQLYRHFASLGYESRLFSWRGDEYGLAQARPRVALVGFRDGLERRFVPPRPVIEPQARTTVGQALYDQVAENGWPHAAYWRDGKGAVGGPTVVGGSNKSGRDSFGSNFQSNAWNDIQIDIKGLAEVGPGPDHPRDEAFLFTLRMGARLQGFPDHWSFWSPSEARRRPADGTRSREWWRLGSGHRAKRQQIGNALPPVMAAAVGLQIYSALVGVKVDLAAELRDMELPPRGPRKPRLADLHARPWDQALEAAE